VRRVVPIVVAAVVTASCIPWLRHQRFFSAFVAIITVLLAMYMVFGFARAFSSWMERGRQQDSAQFGWRSPRLRNLMLGAALIVVLVLTVPHFVATRNGAYKLALATAHETPKFVEALGTPISEAWFSEGKIEYGDAPKAELAIPVTGSKQKGNLQVVAIKEDGRWRLQKLTLELVESGERIDLLQRSR
jgi:Cytochrome oxidase complex assembly protein 1